MRSQGRIQRLYTARIGVYMIFRPAYQMWSTRSRREHVHTSQDVVFRILFFAFAYNGFIRFSLSVYSARICYFQNLTRVLYRPAYRSLYASLHKGLRRLAYRPFFYATYKNCSGMLICIFAASRSLTCHLRKQSQFL